MAARKLSILFSGMVAADPYQGGATWAVLQYLLGLQRLGHEVHFVEPLPDKSLQPQGARLHDSLNQAYFDTVTRQFGLQGRCSLLRAGTTETAGLPYSELREVARHADVLINVSGMLADEALLEPIGRRVYLDLDPAFIQCWQAIYGIDMRFDAHTDFVTVGLNLGAPSCPLPLCARHWITTPQPVVLDQWPVAGETRYNALTTIGNWRGYGSVEHEGIFYGQKAHSLREFFDLPSHTTEKFELALAIHPEETADLQALDDNGWNLLDPAQVAATPDSYRDFIGGSKGEFGIAKSCYVRSRCGWFSDRSVCYLASGRPVIAQDTAWSDYLPHGEGLIAFTSNDDVLRAIDSLNHDYSTHRRAARDIAVRHFDSDKVLQNLLQKLDLV